MNLNHFVAILPIPILTATHIILKKDKPFRNSIKCAIGGTVALLLLESLTEFSGTYIPLNLLTLSCAALLGVPGVATMTVLNTLFFQ